MANGKPFVTVGEVHVDYSLAMYAGAEAAVRLRGGNPNDERAVRAQLRAWATDGIRAHAIAALEIAKKVLT